MAVSTETGIEAQDGCKVRFTDVAVGIAGTTNTHDATLVSEDAWSKALSTAVDVIIGDTDAEIFGGKLAQKSLQVTAIIGFWIGNRCGAMAAEEGKEKGFAGLAF